MNARDRVILMVAVVLALVVGSWVMVVQPKRDQAAKLGAAITAAQTTLDSARSQALAGETAKRSYASDFAKLALLGQAIPADDNVPSLIYQLQSAANAAGVDFRVLKLTATPGASVATAPSSAAAGAPTSQSAIATLPPGAAVGPAGLPTLPFTFTFQGSFFGLSDFFNRVDKFVVATNKNVSVSGRLVTLNAINLAVGPKGFPQILATISANAFLVPLAQGVMGGASPTGPVSGSSTPVTTAAGATPAAPAGVAR